MAKGLQDALVSIDRVPDLSCGIICVILRLAVLIQYRSVTNTHTQTDGQTHDDGIYRYKLKFHGSETDTDTDTDFRDAPIV